MKTRMNLFRQMTGAVTNKPKLSPSMEFKLGFHGTAALVIFGLSMVGISFTYFSQQAKLREIRQKQDEAQAALAQTLAEANRLTAEIQRRKAEAAEKLKSKAASGPVFTDKIDPTWSALLWKISAFTGTRILISQMDLTVAGGAAAATGAKAGRTLSLTGSATSNKALRDWLDILIRAVPGYDFSVESATEGSDEEFPVGFRVNARVL